MATISKIASPAEAPLVGAPSRPDRVVAGEAGQQQAAKSVEPIRPKGVKYVLKQQHDRELHGQAVPEKDLRELVRDLQETIDRATRDQYEVGFREDSESGTQVIEIKDKDGKLIKQFPPEKMLNLSRKMDELSGMVIDEMT